MRFGKARVRAGMGAVIALAVVTGAMVADGGGSAGAAARGFDGTTIKVGGIGV